MEEIKLEVKKYTKGIPICPYCNKPTIRDGANNFTSTLMYFSPIYDENGNNTNPDRNILTWNWHCTKCGNYYEVSGNDIDGYFYTNLKKQLLK